MTGARLYTEPPPSGMKGCAECHGDDGRGSDATPRLAGQHATYLADQMNRFRNGKRLAGQTPEHPRVPHLTDQEVTALSHYLSTLH
jgi:cytochrome c553